MERAVSCQTPVAAFDSRPMAEESSLARTLGGGLRSAFAKCLKGDVSLSAFAEY